MNFYSFFFLKINKNDFLQKKVLYKEYYFKLLNKFFVLLLFPQVLVIDNKINIFCCRFAAKKKTKIQKQVVKNETQNNASKQLAHKLIHASSRVVVQVNN